MQWTREERRRLHPHYPIEAEKFQARSARAPADARPARRRGRTRARRRRLRERDHALARGEVGLEAAVLDVDAGRLLHEGCDLDHVLRREEPAREQRVLLAEGAGRAFPGEDPGHERAAPRTPA
jgi:hypothetical protein